MSNLNPEYFPQHRQRHEIKLDISRLEKRYRDLTAEEKQDQAVLNSIKTSILEFKLEYAKADAFEVGLSMMHISRVDDDYFQAMREWRERKQAVVNARHNLIQHVESIK